MDVGKNMLEELKGRRVEIQMGSTSIFTDKHKGMVTNVGESWIEIKTKDKITSINLAMVGSISVDANYKQVDPK